MPYEDYTPDEVAARAKAIYDERIRDQVEAENKGKFLVIDIESGDYEIDADHYTAMSRVKSKRPDGVLFGIRIGFSAAYSLGGHGLQ